MVRVLLILWLFTLLACGNKKQEPEATDEFVPEIERDLDLIREDGVLKAITIYSSTSYFLYRGQPMGFEYELLERLADHLDLKLEIILADDIDDLFGMLNRGEGDIIAYGLTITGPRKEIVDFTHHYVVTHQTLVQRKPDNWRKMKIHQIQKALITDALELVGDTVSVRKNSSYYHRLINLSEELGKNIYIDTIDGNLSTEEIIKKVVNNEIKYTVSDYNIAAINKTFYPILDISTPVSFSQRIAWAVRKNSPQLKESVDQWIKAMKKKVDYYVIYNKYFNNKKQFRKRLTSEFFSKNSDKISMYDDIIKRESEKIGWDWRLVSALVYQESRFRPKVQSWVGAKGLMQIMPSTARELGVKDPDDPEQSVIGGVKYLGQLYDRWMSIPDSTQRIKFTIASYNCGYNHVVDAQKLAKKYGRNELVWDNSVEEYILKLSNRRYFQDDVVGYGYVRGSETVNYVEEIFDRYNVYIQFIEEEGVQLAKS